MRDRIRIRRTFRALIEFSRFRIDLSKGLLLFLAVFGLFDRELIGADLLRVVSDFEGGSVKVLEIDSAKRSITFTPGGEASRGWPCWWYFGIEGITPGESITLRLQASTSVVKKPGTPDPKPLSISWATPEQATFSHDGETWLQTEKGVKGSGEMVYTLQPESSTVLVAWGPPYTPATAKKSLEAFSAASSFAKVTLLCRSREDREVPMLHVQEGDLPKEKRLGVWVQARQHAWESGSSWVAQGFAEWLVSNDPSAGWLRQHAEIYLVPIMDVDNVATGNGGKDALPQDHNRDWSPKPHWNEVAAAQRRVSELIEEGRMDLFLDLHNPAPGDPTFFYVLESSALKEPMVQLRDRFMELAYARIQRIKPMIPMSNKPKTTGPSYHPLWRQISGNWVSMHGNPHTVSVCLETAWNSRTSNTEGYRAVGANLAAAVSEFLAERRSP